MNILVRWIKITKWPLFLGVLGALLPFFVGMPPIHADTGGAGTSLLSTVASVGAVITGFVGVSVSILLTDKASLLLGELKKTDGYKELMHFVRMVLVLSLCLIFTSILGFMRLEMRFVEGYFLVYEHVAYPHILFLLVGLLAGAYMNVFQFIIRMGLYDGRVAHQESRRHGASSDVLDSSSYKREADKLTNPNALNQDSYREAVSKILPDDATSKKSARD